MKSKKYVGLSQDERNQICIMLRKKNSIRDIAYVLERSPNTISREIKINSVNGKYSAKKAQAKSRKSKRSRRYQNFKIERNPNLRKFIVEKMETGDWAPDDISGYLEKGQDVLPTVSTPQIYAWLYSSYGQPYCQYLLTRRYRTKKRPTNKTKRVMITDRTSISERPSEANDRKEIGHHEGDTIVSGKRTHSTTALVVIQERTTRFVTVKIVPNLHPDVFAETATSILADRQTRTLTLDNGIENKHHAAITAATGAPIYFCDPYKSCQKGGVENANKMIRRYVPKGCDISKFSQDQIDEFVWKINNKPRRCLGYKSALQLANEKGTFWK